MNWQKIKISISTKISKTVTTIEQNKNFRLESFLFGRKIITSTALQL